VARFESVAKGSCSADSDVDLLIIVDRIDEDVKLNTTVKYSTTTQDS